MATLEEQPEADGEDLHETAVAVDEDVEEEEEVSMEKFLWKKRR